MGIHNLVIHSGTYNYWPGLGPGSGRPNPTRIPYKPRKRETASGPAFRTGGPETMHMLCVLYIAKNEAWPRPPKPRSPSL